MNPASVWVCSEDAYNADRGLLRASSLKVAIKSLAEYHDRFVANPPKIVQKQTRETMLGSVVHCMSLEPGEFLKRYAVRPDGIDGRTKKGKELLDAYRAESIGKIDISTVVVDCDEFLCRAREMSQHILGEQVIGNLIASAVRERSITWLDDETGLGCKCRADLFIERPLEPSDLILDLKTSQDPTPENWGRGGMFSPIGRFRYDLQGAHYCDGVSRFTGRPCDYGLIVVGSHRPHDVFLYDLTAWLPVGGRWRREAIRNVARAMKTGNWRRAEQGNVVELKPTQWDNPEDDENE
jgi:hypothetical protein